MRSNRNARFAWLFFGLVVASVLLAYSLQLSSLARENRGVVWLIESSWGLIPIVFAFVGALIVSRQPRNVIGLLLLLPAFSFALPTDTYVVRFQEAPADPSLLLLAALWFNNWGWVLLIFPILFILVLFPSGQPPGRRWRGLIYVGIGMMLTMLFLSTFASELGPIDGEWVVPNPIGFRDAAIIKHPKLLAGKPSIQLERLDELFPSASLIPLGDWLETYFTPVWVVLLPLLTIGCAAALFVRFRRARGAEREQIKWLFFASALFVTVYVPSFFSESYTTANNIWDALFVVGILTIPAAIAIAILRYRLYDIDIIIRRTLQYALITGLLALIYFGSIVLLQGIFGTVTGEQSPVVIVLSTLLIAALFTPLRRRVQEVIDRRFFRQKYDAQQVLAQFALTARDETDLDVLTAELARVITEAVQPDAISIALDAKKSQ